MASNGKLVSELPVDKELMAAVTESVQAQEKLASLMRNKLETNPLATHAINESNNLLDSLRHLKSSIEGTTFNFAPITLSHDSLSLLRHLVVAHTPGNMTESTKAKIADKVSEIFEGQVKRLVYACILSCPWFSGSQSEVSSQAKNNVLYIVYVARDEQFFSLATQHEKELFETLDHGHLFACEVRHFCAQLRRSNVRAIEALSSPPEGIIFSSPEWFRLASLIDPTSLLTRTFVDRCVGQAMGALVKKRPVSGRLIVRDDALLSKFCDSFRLLYYAQSAVDREAICSWFEVGRNEEEKEIVKALTDAFEGLVHKEKLLQYVVRIKERVESRIEEVSREPPKWSHALGEWLTNMRMEGVQFSRQDPISTDPDPHREFLDSQGLTSVHSRDLIVVAKGGSHMYNLATPTSDTDYIIVFREPTQTIISSSTNLKESMDNKGRHADTEIAAYECRLFSEMLLKGAVNIFELIYADNLYYTSSYWDQLTAYKDSFMSEKVILQYIGFIKTHMKRIESKKYIGTVREGKLFYQIFHKLLSLESFVKGGSPIVVCEGKERDFILKIRKGPLQDDIDRDLLYLQANERLSNVRSQLMDRMERFHEFGDYRILQTWLLKVRGITLEEPLKLATPPLVQV